MTAMATFLRRDRRGAILAATAAIVALGIAAGTALVGLSGTKTGMALALGATIGPVLAYVALAAPLVFPFCAYVALVPFDNVLNPDGSGTITRLLAIVTGGALAFYMLRTGRIAKPSRWLLVWLALYAWMAASAFWAIDTNAVFSLFPTAVQLLGLYAAIAFFPSSPSTVRWAVGTTLVAGVLAAGYGAFLFTHGMDVGKGDRLWITTDAGNYVDPNHFAAALLLPFALTLTATLYARNVWQAVLGLAGLVALCEGIAVSASRGAIIGAGAIIVYLFARNAHRVRLLALAAVAVVCGLLTQTSLGDRFSAAFSSGGSGRTDIWVVGLAAMRSHWLFGAGYNNFAYAYDQAFLQAHQLRFMNWHRAPHNILLNVVVELGIPGAILLLAAWYGQFRMLRSIAPAHPDYPIRIALEATVIGTFVAALFLDVMVMKYLWLTFMLIAIVRNSHETESETSSCLKHSYPTAVPRSAKMKFSR
jgi:O-antigen ligase